MAEYLQIQNNGKIVLLGSICRAANLQEGDMVEVIVEEDGTLRLIPKRLDERKLLELFELEDINWALNQK